VFGYVRPPLEILPQEEADRFRRAYCGLCHILGERYGPAARMILNYDFTYLEWPGIHEWYFWDESVHLAFEHFFGPGSAFNPYSLEGRKRGMQR